MSDRTTTRPSTAKSVLTRQRILDAAAQVLAHRGFAGTRLSDVAEVANLQTASIYYHFASRHDLIETVVLEGTRRTYEQVVAAVDAMDPESSPMDRICVAVGAHLRMVLELSSYPSASIRTSGQLPEEIRAKQQVGEATYGEFWSRLLSAGRASGEVRSDLDPLASRMLVVGALNWASEWWRPERWSVQQAVDNATTMVRRALSAVD